MELGKRTRYAIMGQKFIQVLLLFRVLKDFFTAECKVEEKKKKSIRKQACASALIT